MNLKLENNKWYAWQMLPGYDGDKYLSPIKIKDIDRSKGADTIILNFYNACYTQGDRGFSYELKIIAHSKECLICTIEKEGKNKSNRMTIIEEIDYQWLSRYITKDKIVQDISISDYLDKNY